MVYPGAAGALPKPCDQGLDLFTRSFNLEFDPAV